MSHTLRQLSPQAKTPTDVDIILVPGPGSMPVEQWGIFSYDFSHTISSSKATPRILAFIHDVKADGSFSWRGLLGAGDSLLDALFALSAESEFQRPMIFICHSLGGVIVKQGLSKANQHHQNQHHMPILNLVSGIIFLGTPHNQLSQEGFQDRAFRLLKCCANGGLTKQQTLNLAKDFWMLGDVAKRFQYSNIRVDVLSVYEDRATKIEKTKFFSKSSKQIIVDKTLCTTLTTFEQWAGLQQDHLGLCNLTDDSRDGQTSILRWLMPVIENSTQNVAERLEAFQLRHKPSPTASSFSSFGAMRNALSKKSNAAQRSGSTEEDTGEATQGSTDFDAVMIPILENFAPARRNAKLPCFMVETFGQNSNFVGREDILNKLDAALLPSKESLVSFEQRRQKYAALCGMGGLGKTEIAIEFAFSRRNEFDAVFWLRADSREKLDTDLAKVPSFLDLEEPSDAAEGQVISRELAKGWLSSPRKFFDCENDSVGTAEATWLLILDNADDPDVLTDYTHFFGSGSVLVTSRHPLAKQTFSENPLAIDLQPFKDEDAVDLLQKITGGSRQLDEALEIVKRLGGLPLAISQMAGIIRRQMLTYPEFLRMYEDQAERTELYGLEMQPRQPTARGNVATIWAIDRLSPHSRSFLNILAFLDPDGIQDCILDMLLRSHSEYQVIPPDVPKTRIEFNFARAELLERSLIRRNEHKGELWIHRVLQDTARGKMNHQKRFEVFTFAVDLIHLVWPKAALDRRHNTTRWALCQTLYPHILFLRTLYLENDLQGNAEVDVRFAILLNEAGWWQLEKGNSHSSHSNRDLLRHAYAICELYPQTNVRDLKCDIHYSLGAVANETNDAESCIQHNTAFLEIRENIAKENGKVDLRLGIAYNQMGTGWMMAKDFARATTCFQTAIDTYQKLPDFSPYMLSIPLANLGLSNWLQGYFDEASKILLRGLEDRESMYGKDDHESFRTGRLLHALGNVRADQGLLEESESYHQRALASYQAAIGNNHHRTADVCHKVAQHCLRRLWHNKALVLVNQALKVWGADRGAYLPEISRTSFLKSKVMYELGNEQDALVCFKEAAAGLQSISTSQEKKDYGHLTEEDFDATVTFWSK